MYYNDKGEKLYEYIFVAGAPGSKWSSVVKNIYYSESVDRTDYTEERTYEHSAWGRPELMHLGAYFDPGMEFGKHFMRMNLLSKEEHEKEFRKPFYGTGSQIIKSHVFCHQLDYLRQTWPEIPIVLVYRPDDAALGWWVRCGQFNITYPNYQYYSNLEMMGMHINKQNADMLDFMVRNFITFDVVDNLDLCERLRLDPPGMHRQNYAADDIKVAVVLPNAV